MAWNAHDCNPFPLPLRHCPRAAQKNLGKVRGPIRVENKILDEYIHIDYFKFISLACLSELTFRQTWALCKNTASPLKGFFTDTVDFLSMVPVHLVLLEL